jgi:hypothetical protein
MSGRRSWSRAEATKRIGNPATTSLVVTAADRKRPIVHRSRRPRSAECSCPCFLPNGLRCAKATVVHCSNDKMWPGQSGPAANHLFPPPSRLLESVESVPAVSGALLRHIPVVRRIPRTASYYTPSAPSHRIAIGLKISIYVMRIGNLQQERGCKPPQNRGEL